MNMESADCHCSNGWKTKGIKHLQKIYLLLLEGQRLAVWVWFNAASVMRSRRVQDLHQALQGVLRSDVNIISAVDESTLQCFTSL